MVFGILCLTIYYSFLAYSIEIISFVILLKAGIGISTNFKCLSFTVKLYFIFIQVIIINTFLAATETVSNAMKEKYGETVLKDRGYEDILNPFMRSLVLFVVILFAYLIIQITGLEQTKIILKDWGKNQNIAIDCDTKTFQELLKVNLTTTDFPLKTIIPMPDVLNYDIFRNIINTALSDKFN